MALAKSSESSAAHFSTSEWGGIDKAQPKDKKRKSSTTAAVLAITLGFLGVHKFYLGNLAAGFIHLAAFFIAFVSSAIIGIWLPVSIVAIFPIIEGVLYTFKTDEQFNQIYVEEGRRWL